VIPAKFEYTRAATIDEALAALGQHGDEAKLLAGGHSLLPLMKLRLATPAMLVDIGRLSELSYVRDEGDTIAIGALTRHRDVETSDVLREHAPLLAFTASLVGDPQVRHRGTLGGSLAHGDPASDLPGAVLAMNATMVIAGAGGARREVPATEFFDGFLETAVGPEELLVEVRVPKATGKGWSYQKFNRRAQDWAIVGVAYQQGAGVALVNMASTPVRASSVEAALASGSSAEDAAASADEGLDPTSDLNASTEYRRHLARVLTRRAIDEAASSANTRFR
jgi:carbon-monoxide dehydrogenase medium subunit